MSCPTLLPLTDDRGVKSKFSRIAVYQAICEVLMERDRLAEATECFNTMTNDVERDVTTDEEHGHWVLGELRW